jgi:hypothetical protein
MFHPFGICIAVITTRAASFTQARVHALQQRRLGTFPMRRRRRRSRQGRTARPEIIVEPASFASLALGMLCHKKCVSF